MENRLKKLDMNSENALKELQGLTAQMHDAYEQRCKEAFAFSAEFAKQLIERRAKLPYQLNLLDELRPNENSHSRILWKLLQYKNSKGEYEIYESLLQYIINRKQGHQQREEFERIHIKKPVMTQETERIDLWIRDNGYAIIFENKVYNAIDQEAQLERYIDKTKEKYEDKDIFVVYLSSAGQEPADQSWGGYKKNFVNRYVNLSFKDDIYPWLKDNVLPEVRRKDVYLQTALVQYVDYLAGQFYLREIEKQMNMDLDEVIRKYFCLENKNKEEQVKVLDEKMEEMQEALNKVGELKDRLHREIMAGVVEKIKASSFKNLIIPYGTAFVAVKIERIESKPVVVYIGQTGGKLYCQVEFHYDLSKEDRVIKEESKLMKLKEDDLLPSRQPDCIWKWTDRDYEATYNLFCKVVDRCIAMSECEKGHVASGTGPQA